MTTSDERNFRSSYYEKVGFRNVEERKSLEMLLKDKKPLDRLKLKHFCLRYTVPASHRSFLWNLVLGVLPVHLNIHPFIKEQQRQEYEDLLRALNIMRIVNSNTPKHQVFLAVWLLRTGNLRIDASLEEEYSFSLIAQCMINFHEDDVSTYWASTCFYANIKKFEPDILKLIEATWNLLEREDTVLFRHFQQTRMLYNLPLERWFDSAFANVIDSSALARIWDKICGGSCKILIFVAVILFVNQRQKLLKIDKVQDVIKCLQNISEEGAEIIANKAIDMWQQLGSPLTVYDKPKS